MSKKTVNSSAVGQNLERAARHIGNPDDTLVNGSPLPGMEIHNSLVPSKMFEDGGALLNTVALMAKHSLARHTPKTPEECYENLQFLCEFCSTYKVPPTLGLYADLACGTSVPRLAKIERDKSNPELSEAITHCKGFIRDFLELSAIDGRMNPIVYFHMNKVYFGAVENQKVTVEFENNTEITPEEYERRMEDIIDVQAIVE